MLKMIDFKFFSTFIYFFSLNFKSIKHCRSRSPSNSEKDEVSIYEESGTIREILGTKKEKYNEKNMGSSFIFNYESFNTEKIKNEFLKRGQTLISLNENRERKHQKDQKEKIKKNDSASKFCDNLLDLIRKIQYNDYDKRKVFFKFSQNFFILISFFY